MNEEPPRKSFWEVFANQNTVATILAITLFVTLETIAILAGMAVLEHKYELSGGISDMFKIVLGGIGGSLATYIGVKRNGKET